MKTSPISHQLGPVLQYVKEAKHDCGAELHAVTIPENTAASKCGDRFVAVTAAKLPHYIANGATERLA